MVKLTLTTHEVRVGVLCPKKEERTRSVTRRAVTSLSLQAQVSEGEDGRSPLLCEILRFTLKPAISLSRGEQLGISGSRDDP